MDAWRRWKGARVMAGLSGILRRLERLEARAPSSRGWRPEFAPLCQVPPAEWSAEAREAFLGAAVEARSDRRNPVLAKLPTSALLDLLGECCARSGEAMGREWQRMKEATNDAGN